MLRRARPLMAVLAALTTAVAAAAAPAGDATARPVVIEGIPQNPSPAPCWVLAVGVSQYDHIPELRYCADDARAVKAALQDRLHLPDDHVRLLCDHEASSVRLRETLAGLARDARPQDLVLIYFSGHGVIGPGRQGAVTYLATADLDPGSAEAAAGTAFRMDDFANAVGSIPARRIILMLDCCFSGNAGQAAGRAAFQLPGVPVGAPIGDSLKADLARAGAGLVVMTASRPDQKSFDDPGSQHGAFTHFLLQSFKDPGEVTVTGIYREIAAGLKAAPIPLGEREQQEPMLFGQMQGDLTIAPARSNGPGRLHLLSSPLDAQVYVDDEKNARGPTPLDLDLSQGYHRLTILKEGYLPDVEEVPIFPGTVTSPPVILVRQRTTGGILVQAAPGAEIRVEGRPAGRVPPSGVLFLRDLSIGLHVVQAEKDGRKGELSVVVPPGETALARIDHTDPPPPPPPPPPPGMDQKGSRYFWRTDDAEMVPVPAGPFIMGSDTEDEARPKHTQDLRGAYWIDRFEVTNAQFLRFVQAAHPRLQGGWHPPGPGEEELPAVDVTFEDAQAYAQWAGKRLPTEAEWEKAARGVNGRLYPYGDRFEATMQNVASNALVEAGFFSRDAGGQVGGRGASPYGAVDMVGNAAEWCDSPFAAYPGSPPVNVHFNAAAKVVRGGSFRTRPAFHQSVTTAARSASLPDAHRPDLGFRCVVSAP